MESKPKDLAQCATNETNVVIDQHGRIYATFERAQDVPQAINVTCGQGLWKSIVSDQNRTFTMNQVALDIRNTGSSFFIFAQF